MERKTILTLRERAALMRSLEIKALHGAKSGHPGGSLSITDAVAYLYFHKMNVDPANPSAPNRDRFVLSKGHCCPAVYAALALKGYFDVSELDNLRKLGGMLQGHPDMKSVPGVDMSTGSLGQGFSAACGMAIAGKRSGAPYRVYTILGDGEIQEGQIWEAAMFANMYGLSNLTAFIDSNRYQIDGAVTDVMSPYPIDEKFRAFGWHVITIDGHDFEQIDRAVTESESCGKPCAIVMDTVKGKGVSYMENNYQWHGKAPKDDEYEIAEKELTAAYELAKEELING